LRINRWGNGDHSSQFLGWINEFPESISDSASPFDFVILRTSVHWFSVVHCVDSAIWTIIRSDMTQFVCITSVGFCENGSNNSFRIICWESEDLITFINETLIDRTCGTSTIGSLSNSNKNNFNTNGLVVWNCVTRIFSTGWSSVSDQVCELTSVVVNDWNSSSGVGFP